MERRRLLDDLRARVAARQVVVVAGAGVAAQASGGAPAATWLGLLRAGTHHIGEDDWAASMGGLLDLGDPASLLDVADQLTVRLGNEHARFLRETIGTLPLVDPRVPRALASWGVPIATTNYDGLIEAATGWQWVTWREMPRLQRVILNGEPVVAHLHGHWDAPDSVVLGVRSYDALLGAAGAQALQQALAATRTLVFVGMGAGADDPNWSALRAWAAAAFPHQDHRHYRLCTTGEVGALEAEHRDERIFPLAYGDTHADLPAFLEALAPPAPLPSPVLPSLPPPRVTIGRDREIARLTSVVLDGGRPGLVLGPPGVGKTNLALAVLHSPAIAERFGTRRYWLRCDAITDPAALPTELAAAVGAPAGTADATAWLTDAPCLVVLDNAETPWEAEPVATEAFLAAVAALPGVDLVVSMRGAERPGGPAWTLLRLAPLASPPARELFLSIADDRFADDHFTDGRSAVDGLDDFLAEMGGLPLAIQLLAHVAETEPDLATLTERWRQERTALLRRAGGTDKSLSVAASFELSWSSPLLTEPARRLLSLLGALPDGIAHQDLDDLVPGHGLAAAATLRQRALAFDEKARLRTHPPLRHHLAARHPPTSDDLTRAWHHYIDLTRRHGDTVGRPGGQVAHARLRAEVANIGPAFAGVLDSADPEAALRGVAGLGEFGGLGGVDVLPILTHAARTADDRGDTGRQAEVRLALARVASARSDHGTSAAWFSEAVALYEQTDDARGMAHGLRGLGYDLLERWELDLAGEMFQHARSLYRQTDNKVGEAVCVRGQAAIALRRSDLDDAERKFLEALAMCREAGDVLDETACVHALGDIALRRSDLDGAIGHYESAIAAYQQTGHHLGEANCMQRFGDIALQRSDVVAARHHFEDALDIFRRIEEPYSIGQTHWRLARIDRGAGRRRHTAAARAAFSSIGRGDLIEVLEAEMAERAASDG